MPDRKFKIGDIVRCTEEGKAQGAYGYLRDKLEVVALEEYWQDSFIVRLKVVGENFRPRWREKWYELVEPKDGPW